MVANMKCLPGAGQVRRAIMKGLNDSDDADDDYDDDNSDILSVFAFKTSGPHFPQLKMGRLTSLTGSQS